MTFSKSKNPSDSSPLPGSDEPVRSRRSLRILLFFLVLMNQSEVEEVFGFFPVSGLLVLNRGQALIILHPKLGQMVNGIVLPIKKVFALVDSKISVEIKDEGRKLQGRLVAVDEYLNIHMDETIEFVDNQRGRSLGTVVIRGNNILTIAPVI
jgi:small nuclear ribonucleoprotein (snRNP)-like protein